jgi:ADP-heptose:LPS heptosyltransferase
MKLLVIRMSSLGDVVLSTAFLENLPEGTQVDWVIASEFAFVLKGHPKIRRLIEFKKKSGLGGWIRLLKELKKEKYDARFDLHVTLRSKIARWYYGFTEGFSTPWFSISKERVKFLAYVTLKEFCPRGFRPTPFWQRFARLAQKVSRNPVHLKNEHLNPPCYLPVIESRQSELKTILGEYHLQSKKYYALMPASRWSSKEWSAQSYVELACTLHSSTDAALLLMGRESDAACQYVKNELLARKVPFVSALTEPDFTVTALLIQQAIAYVGGDTGLAHLAEAVGTPSVVIFGPTRPELGFGPWSRQSSSVFSEVWCSPCSKDGKICYRYTNRFACLKKIEVERVRTAVPR